MNLTEKQKGFLSFGAAVFVLMMSMSFALYLVDPCNSNLIANIITGNNIQNCMALPSGATALNGTVAGVNNQLAGVFSGLGVIGGAGVIVLAATFPNGYALTATLAYFLLGGFDMPVNLFNANSGLPNEIRLFFIALFSLLNIFAVLSYLGAKNY